MLLSSQADLLGGLVPSEYDWMRQHYTHIASQIMNVDDRLEFGVGTGAPPSRIAELHPIESVGAFLLLSSLLCQERFDFIRTGATILANINTIRSLRSIPLVSESHCDSLPTPDQNRPIQDSRSDENLSSHLIPFLALMTMRGRVTNMNTRSFNVQSVERIQSPIVVSFATCSLNGCAWRGGYKVETKRRAGTRRVERALGSLCFARND